MNIWMQWLIVALLALAMELFTGSFFLLVLAVGLAAASLLAVAGSGIVTQAVTAGAVTLAGWAWLWRKRRTLHPSASLPSLDAGAPVRLLAWTGPARCRVQYRGAEWQAELVGPHHPDDRYIVACLDGNILKITADSV